MRLKDKLRSIAWKACTVVTCTATLLNFGVSSLTANGAASEDTSNYEGKKCSFTEGCKCPGNAAGPYHWNQTSNAGTEFDGGAVLEWSDFKMPGGSSIGSAGCYATSIAIEMGLSGCYEKTDGKDTPFCPMVLFNWGKRHGGIWSGNELNSPANIGKAPGHEGDFHLFAIDDSHAQGVDLGGLGVDTRSSISTSGEKLYALAIDLMKQGCYVVVHVSGHFMAAVGYIDADNELGYELLLSDPGTGAGETATSKGERMVFKKADADKTVTGYNVALHSRAGGIYTASELIDIRVFIMSQDFSNGQNAASGKNMQEAAEASAAKFQAISGYLDETYFLDINVLSDLALELPCVESLYGEDLGAVKELYDWKEQLENKRENRVYRGFRAVFMFIGIIIVIYSTMLFVAYQFDRINNFFEFSLLEVLSFRRLTITTEGEQGSNFNDSQAMGMKRVNFKNICVISLMGIAIGIMLLSGYIYTLAGLVMKFLHALNDWLGTIL